MKRTELSINKTLFRQCVNGYIPPYVIFYFSQVGEEAGMVNVFASQSLDEELIHLLHCTDRLPALRYSHQTEHSRWMLQGRITCIWVILSKWVPHI